ncbi:hypothetical protein LRR18_08755 [Mangrovimonas sp. AS39]|uniref:hypothetical protein n=1 Tax=Mangrovimonas TaxID=1211036 RepID=UPI0006B484F6|nr:MULTISPECIES: hypothetical protein [Mangrovimonas]MCF1191672.1 hypothetical protein [Mangrovimonas futianensis]MCF1195440.1 hypothetical protein [Mangrovimonas futianensis]NIK91906.1 hypothetical protein [Mangrovimonas sp. CR14]
MRKIIVDYKRLTPEILKLLTEKFPDGYGDDDIITFDNHHNQTIEAVEVRTEDAIYLVKVSSKLHYTMTNFESIEDLEVDDLGNVIINEDFKGEVYNDDEEE